MPTPEPQFNSPKKLVRRIRIPKIGPRKSKGFFEEYFYVFLAALFLSLAILLKAGGMATYDSVVMALWIAGLIWFVRQARTYYKEKSGPAAVQKPVQTPEAKPVATNGKLPPGMKPMIGPQWPLKASPKPSSPTIIQEPSSSASKNKPAFVYERPTLPDRKPKLPANWPGQQDKKTKR